MKAGRSLRALLEEVKRQEAAKEDIAIDTRELEMRMSYQGALMRMPGRVAPVRDIAHGQIAEHAGIPSAYYARMRHDAPHLLASNVNHWFRASPERRMVRLLDGNLRAFLSERYARIDNSNIAEAVLPVLFEVPDVQIVSAEITESRMYLKVVAPRTQQEVTVGDPVQAGVVVSNSEVGKGAVSIAPLVFRLVCDNGMIVADRHYRRHHIGARAAQDDALYQILSDEAKAAVSRQRTTVTVYVIAETHSSLNSPLVYCRVTSIEPTLVICATTIVINTRLCHLISSCSTKSVPVGRQRIITLKIRFIICFRSAGLVKNFVVVTFYERKENSLLYNLLNSCLLVQCQLLLYEP